MTLEQQVEYFYEKWENAHDSLARAINDLDRTYRERARLVALLAMIYPSTLGDDPELPEWRVVYVRLPTGQASWHISPHDLDLFAHVGDGTEGWDGHTTEEKHQRIEALTSLLAEKSEY